MPIFIDESGPPRVTIPADDTRTGSCDAWGAAGKRNPSGASAAGGGRHRVSARSHHHTLRSILQGLWWRWYAGINIPAVVADQADGWRSESSESGCGIPLRFAGSEARPGP